MFVLYWLHLLLVWSRGGHHFLLSHQFTAISTTKLNVTLQLSGMITGVQLRFFTMTSHGRTLLNNLFSQLTHHASHLASCQEPVAVCNLLPIHKQFISTKSWRGLQQWVSDLHIKGSG